MTMDSGRKSLETVRSLREASATGSLSCPQLIHLDKNAAPQTDPTETLTETAPPPRLPKTVVSHPVKDAFREERPKWKGVSISTLSAVVALGLGGSVVYWGRKWRALRVTPGVITGFALGLVYGLRFCRRYKKNRRIKALLRQILGLPLGERGLFQMIHPNERPLTQLSPSEHVQYVNRVLKQMWPYYEPNICKWIIDFLNPMLEEMKPQFIKNIHFSSLTFGDFPFDITEVTVLREDSDEFVINAGVRWHGNAHVSIMIELKGGGVLHPKFERFRFCGNTRIAFTPLVPYFPGFGAMTLCFQSTPTVDFSLNMNQSMLSIVGEKVRQFLSSFVTDHVFGTVLVWPARIVIPILPERMRGKLDHLELHTRGVLRVLVVEGSGLGSGESHNGFDNHVKPFIVLETVPLQPLATKVLPDGYHPVWREEHFLKVQEIDQSLKVELFDDHYDPVMPSLTSAQRHGRKIGSVSIPLTECPAGETIDRWFGLNGVAEQSTRAVRSKHHGQDILSEMWYLDKNPTSAVRLRLCLTYMPVEELRKGQLFLERPRSLNASLHYGLLFVRLLRAYNLKKVDFLSLSHPYCVLSLNMISEKRSGTARDTLDPEWRENYEWFNVSIKDHLIIEVFSEGRMVDTPMGYIKIPVDAIAMECERDAKVVDAILPLTEGVGDIHIELDWVPLDNNLTTMRSHERSRNRALQAAPRGHLFVKLRWAEELPNVGFLGLTDPYCILKVKGNERRSRVMKDTLNPVWNQEFVWESVKQRDQLEIEIWAKGTLQDTALGRFQTRVEPAIEQADTVYEHTELLMQQDGTAAGRLTFQIMWQRISPGAARRRRGPSSPTWPTPIAQAPLIKRPSLRHFLFPFSR